MKAPLFLATARYADSISGLTRVIASMTRDWFSVIRLHYRASSTEETICSLKGTGKWLDEYELNDKYKDRPARLAAIKKNTRKHECELHAGVCARACASASVCVRAHVQVHAHR